MTAFVIKEVSVVGGSPTDLLLRDGWVVEAGHRLSAAGATVIDAAGLIALPGLVDLHTHLREPGREDAETIESGSRAAALGGYTAVCAMANTSPVADAPQVVERVQAAGRAAGLVHVRPIGAVTVGLAGEHLADLEAMAESAAAVRMFSDDGHCVYNAALMRAALRRVKAFGGVIAQHAEEPTLTAGAQLNDGAVAQRFGLTGWPAAAEASIVARDVVLAADTGARLHICHVSTAATVAVLRWAKDRGAPVTAEVCPHHLLLTEQVIAERLDPVYKVNPPLRTAADVAAVREALVDGIIDAVATDHAPHTAADKECPWPRARPGMVGLQTALPIVCSLDLPGRGHLDWNTIAERMSRTPARIARLAEHGIDPAPGAPANLTLVDPSARWTVDPGALASRSRNTPYAGIEFATAVVATFLRGIPTVLDGKAVK